MTNPLLESHQLPPFSAIRPEHIEPAIRQVLDENRANLKALGVKLDAEDLKTLDTAFPPPKRAMPLDMT